MPLLERRQCLDCKTRTPHPAQYCRKHRQGYCSLPLSIPKELQNIFPTIDLGNLSAHEAKRAISKRLPKSWSCYSIGKGGFGTVLGFRTTSTHPVDAGDDLGGWCVKLGVEDDEVIDIDIQEQALVQALSVDAAPQGVVPMSLLCDMNGMAAIVMPRADRSLESFMRHKRRLAAPKSDSRWTTELRIGFTETAIRQIINGLAHIHTQFDVAHGDLSLRNILVTEQLEHKYTAQICDLGSMEPHPNHRVSSGTTMVASSPEQILKALGGRLDDDTAPMTATKACDVWAVGCLLYYMLTNGRTLFDGDTYWSMSILHAHALGNMRSEYSQHNIQDSTHNNRHKHNKHNKHNNHNKHKHNNKHNKYDKNKPWKEVRAGYPPHYPTVTRKPLTFDERFTKTRSLKSSAVSNYSDTKPLPISHPELSLRRMVSVCIQWWNARPKDAMALLSKIN